jgi:GH15 family glucan-1,4-alpha-glucosidase
MMTKRSEKSARIEDYGLIGDGQTAALVHKDGSIDWLCWPWFDSPACFAALLGTDENGSWRITVSEKAEYTRRYLDDATIIETTIETSDGLVTLTDFMPIERDSSRLIRIIRCERGRARLTSLLLLRPGYGRDDVEWRKADEGVFVGRYDGEDVYLYCRDEPSFRKDGCVSQITLAEGEATSLVLSDGACNKTTADPIQQLHGTSAFWRKWASRCTYEGPWRDAVVRSLITLKALIFTPTGGIVAAPTTSLPECPGGARNWDYRYCWLRDATFTLLAFIHAGYDEEAIAWRDWLLRATAHEPHRIQPFYGIDGRADLDEWEAKWLPGFHDSRPVRIGNSAFYQHQLDTFGEVIDALHQARTHGMELAPASWKMQIDTVRHLEKVWSKSDSGLWESRAKPKRYTFSLAMIWAALNRMCLGAKELNLEAPFDRWTSLANDIHNEVCRHGFNSELNSFVQSLGSSQLDASTLLLPQIGFLPPDDPRIIGTVEAIGKRLQKGGFIYRYNTKESRDGLPPGEAAFIVCNFWYADALVMIGRKDEAADVFERTVSISNDLGLLSEEFDPRTRQLLGNFPQALSHLALVNTAINLARPNGPAHRRSGRA